jgi:TATA-binding protein-associated factor Taf7
VRPISNEEFEASLAHRGGSTRRRETVGNLIDLPIKAEEEEEKDNDSAEKTEEDFNKWIAEKAEGDLREWIAEEISRAELKDRVDASGNPMMQQLYNQWITDMTIEKSRNGTVHFANGPPPTWRRKDRPY